MDMVLRVLGFVHANPTDDPAFAAAVARLEDRAGRAQDLAAQEQSGHIAEQAATLTKRELRVQLSDCLSFLGRLAATASRLQPELPIRLSIPKPHSSQHAFLTGCGVVVTEAQAQLDTLGKFGLTPEYLTNMAAVVAQYAKAIEAKNSGTSSHVGASGEFAALAVELNQLVRLLDAIYRPRFKNDPEKRAAWKSVKDVVRPASKPAAVPAKPGGDAPKAAA
jgi:hypothetical protein